jgi:hypothetical protein
VIIYPERVDDYLVRPVENLYQGQRLAVSVQVVLAFNV